MKFLFIIYCFLILIIMTSPNINHLTNNLHENMNQHNKLNKSINNNILILQPPPNNENITGKDFTCFSGASSVLMFDGTIKYVHEIKKGDSVMLGNYDEGIIDCVVKTIITNPIQMIKLNKNLHITPYYPVKNKYTNEWCFPKDITPFSLNNGTVI